MFETFSGKQISDSPYYIYKRLCKDFQSKEIQYIWSAYKAGNENLEEGTVVLRPYTLKWIYAAATSKAFITNNVLSVFVPFRKSQLLINTWHGGGAYKKVGADIMPYWALKNWERNNSKVKYVISSSRKFSEIFPSSYCYRDDQMLNVGLPRNDIFFDETLVEKAKGKVRKKFSVNDDDLIVLYAPTFRKMATAKVDYEFFDFSLLKKSVRKRFGCACKLFIRFHVGQENDLREDVVNVSEYPDMQELLCAADLFVTDYSSCMWDFALTFKPGFLFTPDIHQYEKDPGVYTPVDNWPFPYAETTEELCRLIENYDEEDAKKKIKAHLDLLGSYEDGHATEKVCKIIKAELLVV